MLGERGKHIFSCLAISVKYFPPPQSIIYKTLTIYIFLWITLLVVFPVVQVFKPAGRHPITIFVMKCVLLCFLYLSIWRLHKAHLTRQGHQGTMSGGDHNYLEPEKSLQLILLIQPLYCCCAADTNEIVFCVGQKFPRITSWGSNSIPSTKI